MGNFTYDFNEQNLIKKIKEHFNIIISTYPQQIVLMNTVINFISDIFQLSNSHTRGDVWSRPGLIGEDCQFST